MFIPIQSNNAVAVAVGSNSDDRSLVEVSAAHRVCVRATCENGTAASRFGAAIARLRETSTENTVILAVSMAGTGVALLLVCAPRAFRRGDLRALFDLLSPVDAVTHGRVRRYVVLNGNLFFVVLILADFLCVVWFLFLLV